LGGEAGREVVGGILGVRWEVRIGDVDRVRDLVPRGRRRGRGSLKGETAGSIFGVDARLSQLLDGAVSSFFGGALDSVVATRGVKMDARLGEVPSPNNRINDGVRVGE
jgi:hypothetical protein